MKLKCTKQELLDLWTQRTEDMMAKTEKMNSGPRLEEVYARIFEIRKCIAELEMWEDAEVK